MSSGGGSDEFAAAELGPPLEVIEGHADASREAFELIRPAGLLRALESGFLYCDRALGRFVPEALNPLLHSGAIAVTSFLVAAVTGIVLLLWYKPSVHLAYASVAQMADARYSAELMRSLHRYSSDACMLFALIHALRSFLERRFGGARWLAWTTGVLMIAILWSIGWTGYWLVWDQRAQSLAVGTARFIDVLPIFADPLARSFLTDHSVNSLLFFVVFFFHMLIPLAMGVFMWLHITRLARSRFLTQKPMTLWLMATLCVLSLAHPATSAAPAHMTVLPAAYRIDWWYLAPLALTDRLPGGLLWFGWLLGGALTLSVPWWLAREKPRPASVVSSRCNACTKCYHDCPYEAIEMLPRNDGSLKFNVQASVIESKCVGCGICAGSCDTAGIGLESFASIESRRRIENWLARAKARGETPHLLFACVEAAGAAFEVDAETGLCPELPGYVVLQVPCAGWVHPLMIERAMRHGAGGVLIASCDEGQCPYREGARWTRERIEGAREPALRSDKVDAQSLRIVALDRTRKRELIEEARAFRGGSGSSASPARRSSLRVGVAASVLAVFAAGGMGLASDLGYAAPISHESLLVVSFKHPGVVSEHCHDLSAEELAALPVHMRRPRVCERGRAPVRLRVRVDGEPRVETSVAGAGLWDDGNSVAVERIGVEPGKHHVDIAIGETRNPAEWAYTEERDLEFESGTSRVVLFDRVEGFGWY